MHCNMGVILKLCAQLSVYLPRFTLCFSFPFFASLRVMIGISAVLVSRRQQAAPLIAFHHPVLHGKLLKEFRL